LASNKKVYHWLITGEMLKFLFTLFQKCLKITNKWSRAETTLTYHFILFFSCLECVLGTSSTYVTSTRLVLLRMILQSLSFEPYVCLFPEARHVNGSICQ
jgi:hypothetical protein